VRELGANPDIGTFATALLADLFIGGRRTQAFFVNHERGNVSFSLIDGTEPRGPNEIALGTETLRRLGAGIGDRVTVKGGAQTRMTIVGRIVLPGIDDDTLGDGAALDMGAANALKPEVDFPIVFARLAPGTDRGAAIDALRARYATTNVQANAQPPAVINLQRVQDLPPQLAQLLLALAVATVVHTVVSSVRESRRDIAVLKTIGFVRRQAVTVVSAQATTFILVALIVGIPIGYVAGRWLWIALADRVGFVPAPTIDVAALTIYAVGVFVAANLAAAWPGRLAARSRPAVELRTE
jgi:FtsX-like permease family protein